MCDFSCRWWHFLDHIINVCWVKPVHSRPEQIGSPSASQHVESIQAPTLGWCGTDLCYCRARIASWAITGPIMARHSVLAGVQRKYIQRWPPTSVCNLQLCCRWQCEQNSTSVSTLSSVLTLHQASTWSPILIRRLLYRFWRAIRVLFFAESVVHPDAQHGFLFTSDDACANFILLWLVGYF